MTTYNPSQDDALTLQANQIPDDESDAPEDDTEDPEGRALNPGRLSSHDHQGKRKFDFPRPTERPPVPAPGSPVLHLPETPKTLNGKRLTHATLARDRDMLENPKRRG